MKSSRLNEIPPLARSVENSEHLNTTHKTEDYMDTRLEYDKQLKDRQRVQEQKFQKMKREEAEKAGDFFSELAPELVFEIMNYSSNSGIRQLGSVSKTFNEKVLGYFHTSTYFAVSCNIDLFITDYYFNEMAGCVISLRKTRNNFDFDGIGNALPKNQTILFNNYREAKSYCKFVADKSFDQSSDAFITESIPAILVVKLHRADLFKIQKCNIQIKEVIPDCPLPPKPKIKTFHTLKTPVNNIDLQFAIFNGTLFCKPPSDNEFAKIWNDAFNKSSSNNIQEKLSIALTDLFNSYVSWPHHHITRHHHDKVKGILKLLIDKKSIPTIFKHLNTLSDDGISEGHFTRMLEFALTMIKPIEDAKKLNGIENILKCNGL